MSKYASWFNFEIKPDIRFSENDYGFHIGPDLIHMTPIAKFYNRQLRHWFENEQTLELFCAFSIAIKNRIDDQFDSKVISLKRDILSTLQGDYKLCAKFLADKFPTFIKVVKGGTPGITKSGIWVTFPIAYQCILWLSEDQQCKKNTKKSIKTL